MLFGFNIHMTQDDYLDFNNCAVKTNPQRRLIQIVWRILYSLVFLLLITLSFIKGDFFLSIFFLICAVLIQVFFNKFFELSIKSSYKKIKNDEEMLKNGYSIEFYEDSLKAFTKFSKEEYLYEGIKNVYIYKNRAVYFYISSSKAFIIPASAFTSADRFNEFTAFVRYKFPNTTFVY